MKKLVLIICLSLVGQVVVAQGGAVKALEAAEALTVLIKSASEGVEATNALVKASEILGVEINALKSMNAAKRLELIKGASSANIINVADIAYNGAIANKASVAKGAEGSNTLVHAEAVGSTKMDITVLSIPQKGAEAVAMEITLANAEAVELIEDAVVRTAVKKNLAMVKKVEAKAQELGLTVLNRDAKVVCENLTLAEAINKKTAIEFGVYKDLVRGKVKTTLDAGKSYVRNVKIELNTTKVDAREKTLEIFKPAKEGGHCELGADSVYYALLNAA